ncbi:hypothetical protein T4A_6280 [Trichinella pseudospiralis]|uniref:Uncharacterized protein n=1 Tax=Trichinella pseudospiralis TaxID=6337 RepID=A0A0V1DVN8_TRIPS|nr:hypothetical protein T4A_436 [Trichinella pseudospiralis]KRY62840.1 hypothetical protein T4A_3647 [Trichinella pseudospiralis]KRY63654.1 hypothetical protein T4A_11661 [Trichinella pseudospiralis]KRY63718.1 hypothetical protein T4A_1243 [Trichinella pseudospiralis]KRY65615.1 hypothetical protein T4A_6280 [Trichinella pseudospiralis]
MGTPFHEMSSMLQRKDSKQSQLWRPFIPQLLGSLR